MNILKSLKKVGNINENSRILLTRKGQKKDLLKMKRKKHEDIIHLLKMESKKYLQKNQ